MVINRRRAPSSDVSREKKLSGHKEEEIYAALIKGKVLHGTQKGDVKDSNNNLHSVKSGKKWQIFLYSYDRIRNSSYLSILLPCLKAFPDDYNLYLADRIRCISYKEKYVKEYGRDKARLLTNSNVHKIIGKNTYISSKMLLGINTKRISNIFKDNTKLYYFLNEALFNNLEVEFLVIKDTTYKKDGLFKVFAKKDVLDILSSKLISSVSIAGRVPEDFNVAGQKILFCYMNNKNKLKNIVEIEIRNDSPVHYRQIRFNMYSKDVLYLLLSDSRTTDYKVINNNVVLHGKAIKKFFIK